MDKYYLVSSFDAIYVVDHRQPLLELARKRFEKRGWSNVFVLCQDASALSLPEWQDGSDPRGSVGLVTMSYSLSMVRYCFTSILARLDYADCAVTAV